MRARERENAPADVLSEIDRLRLSGEQEDFSADRRPMWRKLADKYNIENPTEADTKTVEQRNSDQARRDYLRSKLSPEEQLKAVNTEINMVRRAAQIKGLSEDEKQALAEDYYGRLLPERDRLMAPAQRAEQLKTAKESVESTRKVESSSLREYQQRVSAIAHGRTPPNESPDDRTARNTAAIAENTAKMVELVGGPK
jgi:hypothetical protein